MRMMKRSPNSGRFAEKKRFFVLAALLLLMTAGSLLYITVFGGTYTDHILYTAEQNPVPESLSVTVDNAEVVAAERAYIGADGNICVDFRSLREGSATATVDYTAQPDGTTEGFTAYIRLYVNSFGTIVQKDDLNFDGYIIVEFVILAGLLLVFIFTVVTFIECFRKARFSYYMVACGGVALFAAFTIVLALYDMQWYNTFRFFLMNLSDSGFAFAVLTTPLMLVLSAAIAGSNIWLLRHEGRRPQNMLGIGLGLLWVLGIAAVIGSSVYYFGYSDNGVVLSTQISYSIAYVLSYMECMLLSTIVSAFLATKYKPPFDKDYLIVLGCGIRKDGTLTPILKGRVDAAIRFERAQFAANGKHAKFVPSGGQGSDEVISESEAMKRYLLEQGYPEEQIIKEDKSVNTDQNICFSRFARKNHGGRRRSRNGQGRCGDDQLPHLPRLHSRGQIQAGRAGYHGKNQVVFLSQRLFARVRRLAVCQKMVYFGVGTVIGIVRHAEHDGADLHLFCFLKSKKGI